MKGDQSVAITMQGVQSSVGEDLGYHKYKTTREGVGEDFPV